MHLRSSLRPTRIGLLAASALIWAGVAHGACLSERQALPAQTVNSFLANPGSLTQQFPSGGGAMITQVRDLVASNPAALPAVMGLLANANPDQKSAIGSGLGQAARLCVRGDQAFAGQIQTAITQANDRAVTVAFTAVTGEEPLGGIGGGPGGGGGGGGQLNPIPAGATGSTGVQAIEGKQVNTTGFTYSGGVSGGGGSITTTSTTPISGPVSP